MLSHSPNSATIFLSSPLAAPNLRSQCWILTKSVTPGPDPPERRPATTNTTLSMMLTATIYGGLLGYASRHAADGGRASRCFFVEHLQHTFPHLCELLLWEQEHPLFALCDPPHRRLEFTAEHQAMESFVPMLRGLLSIYSGEVLSGGPQRVLHQHPVSSCLPRIQTFLDPPSDVPG